MDINKEHPVLEGAEVISNLAQTYKQLYLRPGDGADMYAAVVKLGVDPEPKDLSHFVTNPEDTSFFNVTPAGDVRVITLHERHDFETFLMIMGNKCRVYEIPATQGACILDGVINRPRYEAGNPDFKDALIILSVGPYSGVPYDRTPFTEDEWIKLSHTIRQYHECTHFVCRRMFREKIDPIWDELVADAVGLMAAVGKYDTVLANTFLGITDGKYTGGRLENYTDPNEILPRVISAMESIKEESIKKEWEPFEFAIHMEQIKESLWQ